MKRPRPLRRPTMTKRFSTELHSKWPRMIHPIADDLPVIGETPVAEPPFAAPEMIAEIPEPIVTAAPEPPPAAPEIIAEAPEPIAALAPLTTIQPPPLPQPSSQSSPQPAPQPSLGAALLASGIVRMPNAHASGPLAPIRRMTQAEKIAFFS